MKFNEGYYPLLKDAPPVFFLSWRSSEEKQCLVCIHGAGANSSDFSVLGENLAERGISVIGFDRPGHGNTKSLKASADVLMSYNLKVLGSITKLFNVPVSLLCSSGGAMLGMIFIQNNYKNETFNKMPLIMTEPGLRFTEEAKRYLQSSYEFMTGQFRILDHAVQAWDKCILGKTMFPDDACKRNFISGRLKQTGEYLVPALDSSRLERLYKRMSESRDYNILGRRSTLQNPCRVLWGEHGLEHDDTEVQLKKIFQDFRSSIIKGAAHPISLTHPAEIEAVFKMVN